MGSIEIPKRISMARDGLVAASHASIDERTGSMQDHNASIGERNGSIEESNASMAERRASIGRLNGSIGERHGSIGESNASIEEHNGSIGERNGGILLFNKAPYRDVGGMKRRLGRVAMGRWGGVGERRGRRGEGDASPGAAALGPPLSEQQGKALATALRRCAGVRRWCGGLFLR